VIDTGQRQAARRAPAQGQVEARALFAPYFAVSAVATAACRLGDVRRGG
jgi:hypothetical protein